MPKEEIVHYIQTLNKTFGLQISVHGLTVPVSDFLDYGIHSNPYCMLIKQDKRLWHKCKCQQNKILKKDTPPACGTCFAGVFEYIIPIYLPDSAKPQAFISISGYRSPDRAKRQLHLLSECYGLSEKALQVAYETHLRPLPDSVPDEEIIAPLVEMLQKHFASATQKKSNSSDYVYAHAIAYIHQHYKEKIRLEDICNFCHCSKSYISHMFKQRCGTSVSGYIMTLRLKKAKTLLENDAVTVKAAAEAVGFTEPYYFSNSFKKYYNIAPSSVARKG